MNVDSPPLAEPAGSGISPLRLALKALVLLALLNLVFAAVYPLEALGRITLYNRIFPGRARLPYGDVPERAYNLSLYNLEAMFAAHEIASPKPADEFRVVVLGDSSAWGFLLPAEETLTAHLNRAGLQAPDGRRMRFYNLGYPVMSITKDLLIQSYALRYEPDLFLWPITLESLPYDKQLFPPLLQNNPERVRALIRSHALRLNPDDPALKPASFWQRTLIGSRRPLADLIRLQLYGVLWSATGIDQDIPADYPSWQSDLTSDLAFHELTPPRLAAGDLALDALQAGIQAAGSIPVLLINEPMAVSAGENSHLRYNFFYPRWAYDDYRRILSGFAADNGLPYLDAWDLIPPGEFTNSAVHLTPAGSRAFAAAAAGFVSKYLDSRSGEEN